MGPDVYWIPEAVGGRLAVMPRPRSDEWLAGEVAAWKRAGLDVVVSLLEASEVRELGLFEEESMCRANGIEFISFPVADRGVPGSIRDTGKLVEKLQAAVSSGSSIAIHCRAGIGRSALLAGCILKRQGIPEKDVFSLISRARGVTCPDTDAQIDWVRQFPRSRKN
jgi:protein-tyrosine phosphatase